MDPRYSVALTDWLACARRGRREPAAAAARRASEDASGRVVAAGAAGHVLDYDDTYVPGLCHLSAPIAPVACILGADSGASIADVLAGYAVGVETMAALASASHPALYARGWHPTAVCGAVGAAAAAGSVLGLDERATRVATSLALLRAGGLLAAFGSDGKALQVGLAAATGLTAARLAAAGARVPTSVRSGFESAYEGRWDDPGESPSIADNWIKAYPCCLQTHAAIEAADEARRAGAVPQRARVVVHPVSRRAAPYDDVGSGLEAKFSIPYTVALTLLHGPPSVDDFTSAREDVRALARNITVATDADVGESEAVLETPEGFSRRVAAALGSPQRPMTENQLQRKVHSLAGAELDGVVDEMDRPAKILVEAARL
ncbi:MAG: MmgE/PrpD family protein [Actinomycetota bacterium]